MPLGILSSASSELGDNLITAVPERLFDGLVRAYNLSFWGNQLTELPPTLLRNLPTLFDLFD
jgi:UDP-galactopyranose mutase